MHVFFAVSVGSLFSPWLEAHCATAALNPSTCEVGLKVIPQSRLAAHVAPGFSPARAALKGGATRPETEGLRVRAVCASVGGEGERAGEGNSVCRLGGNLFEAREVPARGKCQYGSLFELLEAQKLQKDVPHES